MQFGDLSTCSVWAILFRAWCILDWGKLFIAIYLQNTNRISQREGIEDKELELHTCICIRLHYAVLNWVLVLNLLFCKMIFAVKTLNHIWIIGY